MKFFGQIQEEQPHLCSVRSENGKHRFTLADRGVGMGVVLLLGVDDDTDMRMLDEADAAFVFMVATLAFRSKKKTRNRRCHIKRVLAANAEAQPALF